MFGQCCFDTGDVNCTMGTGSFIDINTGSYPHASVAGNAFNPHNLVNISPNKLNFWPQTCFGKICILQV